MSEFEKQQQLIAIWTAGQIAPYDLFEGNITILGMVERVLVESRSDQALPVICRGDVIPTEISVRVAAQVNPDPLPDVEACIILKNEDGTIARDDNGDIVTEVKMIPQVQEVSMLSCVSQPVSDLLDMHCDMCGFEKIEEKLKKLGNGWYCTDIKANTIDSTETCYDCAVNQMLARAE